MEAPHVLETPKSLVAQTSSQPIEAPELIEEPVSQERGPFAVEITPPSPASAEQLEKIVKTDEAPLLEEFKQLESALSSGTISEAEYDRKFVQLKTQLRRIRSQSKF